MEECIPIMCKVLGLLFSIFKEGRIARGGEGWGEENGEFTLLINVVVSWISHTAITWQLCLGSFEDVFTQIPAT